MFKERGYTQEPWEQPKLPTHPKFPSDTAHPGEIDPIGYYQPPVLAYPTLGIWCWQGELWAAEHLWWEYAKDAYRLKNAEFFNQDAFAYILLTERRVLAALAQIAKDDLTRGINARVGIWKIWADAQQGKGPHNSFF